MIKVYSTPTCPWCKKAKAYLESKNVNFEYVNVLNDMEQRNEMIKSSGQTSVPVINIDGNIIIGFDKEAIDNFIKM